LLAFKKADAPSFAALTSVVQFEDVDAASVAAAAEAGITLRSFAQLDEAGKANRKAHVLPTPDDCAVLCYTCVQPRRSSPPHPFPHLAAGVIACH